MLNPNIILAGQTVDAVNALDAGTLAGTRANDAIHQREYRNALALHGAGALNGDAEAMAQLAQFDPAAMQGLQSGRQTMDLRTAQEGRAAAMHPLQMQSVQLGIEGQRLGNEATRQNIEMVRVQAAQQAAAQAAQMDAAQTEASREALTRATTAMTTAQTPEQWDAYATELGLTDYVGRFADRDFLIARATGTLEGLSGDTVDVPASFQALQMRAEAAGLQPGTPEYQTFMAGGGRGPGSELTITQNPNGGTTIRQGPVAEGGADDISDPTSASSMIATIDGILDDPDLGQGVGWRGAVNQFLGPAAPNARRVDSRLAQLQGQAFLRAFESLKGGGQITEIEGQKATEAIGRINGTNMSEQDYREALTELRGILILAQSRPVGWANTQNPQQTAPAQPSAPAQQTSVISEEQMRGMTEAELEAIIANGGRP